MTPQDAQGALDVVRDALVEKTAGKLALDKPVDVDGWPGRDLVVNVVVKNTPVTLRVRIFLTGQRVYSIQVSYATDTTDEVNRSVDRFFASFHLLTDGGR